jgi:hypothetical protein
MGGAGSALVVFGVLVLVGLPIALSIRGGQPEWIEILFESAVIGLIVELFVAIVLSRSGHYSVPSALVLTLLIVGGTAAAMYYFGKRRNLPKPDRSGLTSRTAIGLVAAALVFIVIAARIRHAPSYFIFQTGDMGGYVNSANILRHSSTRFGVQPQGFTLFLRETNLLLGQANTVAGLPTLGAILLLGVMAFTRTLKLHVGVMFALAFVVLVHPVMVWFSLFPVSEALYATLLVAMLYFVVRARRDSSLAHAAIAGLLAGSLLLVRGEAMLLAPIVVVLLLVSTAADDDATVAVQRRFSIIALVTLFASYAYDARYTQTYFQVQLSHLLPGAVYRFASRHLIELSASLLLAGALGLALVLGATWAVTRWVRPHIVGRRQRYWQIVYGVAILGTAVGLAFFPRAGLTDTLSRWGVLLLVLVGIGLVSVVARPGKYLDPAAGLLFLLVIGVYSVLFARRVHGPQGQLNYLYYDRYLFSEVLPAALLLSTIGLQAVIDAVSHFVSSARVVRIAVVGAVVIVAVAMLPQIHETQRITKYRLLGNSYSAVKQLDTLTRTEGDAPIVYSGPPSRPKNWMFPNTYRAFAVPLQQSFGRKVFGVDTNPAGRDTFLRPFGAELMLAKHGLAKGYLIALRRTRLRPSYPDGPHVRFLGTVSYACPLLPQDANPPPAAPWRSAVFHFDVYALS